MARKTKVIGVSVEPAVAKEYERLAKEARTTKSELFRRMIETYKNALWDQEFRQLQRESVEHVRKTFGRLLTEEEIDRMCFEDRRK